MSQLMPFGDPPMPYTFTSTGTDLTTWSSGTGWTTLTGQMNTGIWSGSSTITFNPDSPYQFYSPQPCYTPPVNPTSKEYIDMKTLYEVFLVYAEDRKAPIVRIVNSVIADSEEDAKVKSGLYADIKPDWDADFLTFFARPICQVKVKSKPQEVKQV